MEDADDRRKITDDNERSDTSIKETLTNYSQESSVHGVKYIGGYQIAGLRKIIWATAILLSIFFCSFMIYPRVQVFQRRPVSTKVTLEYKSPLQFPAVTVCNLNYLRLSYLMSEPGLKIIADFPPAGFRYTYSNATLQDFRNFTYDDVLRKGGHKMDVLFNRCSWLDSLINCSEYFTERLTAFGKCYTFNSLERVRKGGKLLTTTSSGSDHGLWLRVFVEQDEYAASVGLSAGIKVLVHNQIEEPLIGEFGFAVQPGVELLAAVRAQKINYLPAPYEGGMCRNMSDPTIKNPLKYFKHYSHSSCRRECFLKKIFEICNCSYNVPDPSDIGGQLGFCLGASILSLYEILEFIIVFAVKSFTKVKTRTASRVGVANERPNEQEGNEKKTGLYLEELY
ncbi:acid-sensing ion channel 4-B-like [Tubulanus polymorphus]|uniref:acid-sensing ion channel 4-B-like n=1 Tax=Tubulanus polymorphus TaxID=672921 RepID=UPI003DA54765